MTDATILYVDDEAMALKYFERLVSPNYRVLTALSVSEGIEILKTQGDTITVLVSDQRMPGANGNEILRYARHHHPHIVRLLTTAYSELGEAIVAINAGEIYRYITKPWDIDVLRTEVRLAVEVAALRSERDELVYAKIQVQQAQLLANRVGHLALACGSDANTSAALRQYIDIVKTLGGVALQINWRALHYTDWMQSEVLRHNQISQQVKALRQEWSGQAPTLELLHTALGHPPTPADITALFCEAGTPVGINTVICLAWFLAVYSTGQYHVDVITEPGFMLQMIKHPPAPVPPDWLANAMENLESDQLEIPSL